jgi:hypothetical protein
MTGEGLTHRAKKRRKIACPICDKEVNEGYLADHLCVIHGRRLDYKENDGEGDAAEIAAADLEAALDEEANAPEVTYRCSSMATPRCWGVHPKCNQAIFDRNRMRHHFMHRHLNEKIIIDEEGEFPQCPSCGLFGRHPQTHRNTQGCIRGTGRKRQSKRQHGLSVSRLVISKSKPSETLNTSDGSPATMTTTYQPSERI